MVFPWRDCCGEPCRNSLNRRSENEIRLFDEENKMSEQIQQSMLVYFENESASDITRSEIRKTHSSIQLKSHTSMKEINTSASKHVHSHEINSPNWQPRQRSMSSSKSPEVRIISTRHCKLSPRLSPSHINCPRSPTDCIQSTSPREVTFLTSSANEKRRTQCRNTRYVSSNHSYMPLGIFSLECVHNLMVYCQSGDSPRESQNQQPLPQQNDRTPDTSIYSLEKSASLTMQNPRLPSVPLKPSSVSPIPLSASISPTSTCALPGKLIAQNQAKRDIVNDPTDAAAIPPEAILSTLDNDMQFLGISNRRVVNHTTYFSDSFPSKGKQALPLDNLAPDGIRKVPLKLRTSTERRSFLFRRTMPNVSTCERGSPWRSNKLGDNAPNPPICRRFMPAGVIPYEKKKGSTLTQAKSCMRTDPNPGNRFKVKQEGRIARRVSKDKITADAEANLAKESDFASPPASLSDEEALLHPASHVLGVFNDWDASTARYLSITRRSANSVCGSAWTKSVNYFSRHRLLHDLSSSSFNVDGISEDSSDELQCNDDVNSDEETYDPSMISIHTSDQAVGDIVEDISCKFKPRRLYSSGSQSILIGSTIRPRVFSDRPGSMDS